MTKRRSSRNRSKGYSDRRHDLREPRQRFLIVCEGEKTEPNYFKKFREAFRVPIIIKVEGLGVAPSQLVERTQQLRWSGDYDQVWCVFDRDHHFTEFNTAIQSAKNQGIRVAYSNEAFELWYLLHFHFVNTALPRSDYIVKLGGCLGHPYEKNSESIFDELLGRRSEAIRNAERLLAQYQPPNPANDNPSTTVHLLVKELNKFCR